MGYKVYVKDKTTKGRFVQWDGKNRSHTGAVMEAQQAHAKYSGKYKKIWGKQQWIVRKVRKPRPQGFGFGAMPTFRMRF